MKIKIEQTDIITTKSLPLSALSEQISEGLYEHLSIDLIEESAEQGRLSIHGDLERLLDYYADKDPDYGGYNDGKTFAELQNLIAILKENEINYISK